MLFLSLFVVQLLLPVSPVVAMPVRARPDSSAVVDSARAATSAFNWLWRFYWEASATLSLPELGGPLIGDSIGLHPPPEAIINLAAKVHDHARIQLLHCHEGLTRGFQQSGVNEIESGVGSRAVCPFWYYPAGAPPYDERLGIDAGITPRLLPALRDARDSLLATLDRAGSAVPGDGWIAGERVRFALDQGDTARALAAATSCRAQRWWCAALNAYVHDGRGEIAVADSLFTTALGLMPADQRCSWTDLTVLLDQEGRTAYADIPCARRDSINARIWWLSNPLYSEPGNARRAEHFSREVDIQLRSTDAPAERWDWQLADGGLAIREMVLRYGWPAYSYWAGHYEDIDHYTLYLGITDLTTIANGIFATAEYPINRVHTIPWWTAIADPWHADPDDWTLSMPLLPDSVPDFGWWPREHSARGAERLVELSEQQVALFRRESQINLAVATDLRPADIHRAYSDTVDGTLIVSSGPDSVALIPHRSVVGTTVVMEATLPSVPELVGVEYRSAIGRAAVRTRFGITPPPTLAAMKPGEIGISQPVLIHPASQGERPPSSPAAALPLMYGSTALKAGTLVGVYWETYGIKDGDTVDVSVRISQRPSTPLGTGLIPLARPIAQSTASSGITVQWREPDPVRVVTTIAGPHTIQARNVSIDLSTLTPGDYSIEVSVARPGGTPVSAIRDLTILPK